MGGARRRCGREIETSHQRISRCPTWTLAHWFRAAAADAAGQLTYRVHPTNSSTLIRTAVNTSLVRCAVVVGWAVIVFGTFFPPTIWWAWANESKRTYPIIKYYLTTMLPDYE